MFFVFLGHGNSMGHISARPCFGETCGDAGGVFSFCGEHLGVASPKNGDIMMPMIFA
jgi:hypothetical protein